MKTSRDLPHYMTSALLLGNDVTHAIGRLGSAIALDIAREENRSLVTPLDIKMGIERALGEIHEEIQNPLNQGKDLLELINSLANRYVTW